MFSAEILEDFFATLFDLGTFFKNIFIYAPIRILYKMQTGNYLMEKPLTEVINFPKIYEWTYWKYKFNDYKRVNRKSYFAIWYEFFHMLHIFKAYSYMSKKSRL